MADLAQNYSGVVPDGVALHGSGETSATKQTDANKSLVKLVQDELLARAKRFRAKYDSKWPTNYDFFNGKQWDIQRAKWRFSEAVNLVWSTIQTIVPIMTDNRPDVEYSPAEPEDASWTEVLTEIAKHNWQKHGWDYTLTALLYDSQIFDAAHAYVPWNPDLEDGLGDIGFEIMDPMYCFPDPQATDVNCPRSRYFIYAEPVPTSFLKARFPARAKQLKPDVETFTPHKVRDIGETTATTRVYTDTDRGDSGGSGTSDQWGGEDMTFWIRCWMKDETLEDCEKEDENGKTYQRKKKFPKGRYVEIANNLVLLDTHNGALFQQNDGSWKVQPYRDGKIPIAKLVDYIYPREYWGAGEIDQLRGPQKIVNYIWSFLLDHMKMSGNPQWIVSTASGLDPNQLTNEPGLVVETTSINSVRREPGEALPGNLLSMFDMALSVVDKVSGVHDATKGATQPGVTSGLMLEGYIEAAQTRVRLKSRNLDKFLRDVGFLMLSRKMQFYTARRVFRITNKEGWPEYLEFSISPGVGPGDLGTVQGKRFGGVDHDGNAVEDRPINQPIKGMPDVLVQSGSALPFAKAQKAATAKELFSMNAITKLSMLKNIGWPNPEEEVRKADEELQKMAQMQAQQQGAPE